MTDATEVPVGPSPYLRDGLTALAADLRARAENETAIQADQQFKANARRAEIGELDLAEQAVIAELDEMQRRLDQVRATREESRLLLADAEQRAALAGEVAATVTGEAAGLDELIAGFDEQFAPADADADPARREDGTVLPPAEAPGTVVAVHGPTATMPDASLAPPGRDPAPDGTGPRHEKPKPPRDSSSTGGFRALIERAGLVTPQATDQDGDA